LLCLPCSSNAPDLHGRARLQGLARVDRRRGETFARASGGRTTPSAGPGERPDRSFPCHGVSFQAIQEGTAVASRDRPFAVRRAERAGRAAPVERRPPTHWCRSERVHARRVLDGTRRAMTLLIGALTIGLILS